MGDIRSIGAVVDEKFQYISKKSQKNARQIHTQEKLKQELSQDASAFLDKFSEDFFSDLGGVVGATGNMMHSLLKVGFNSFKMFKQSVITEMNLSDEEKLFYKEFTDKWLDKRAILDSISVEDREEYERIGWKEVSRLLKISMVASELDTKPNSSMYDEIAKAICYSGKVNQSGDAVIINFPNKFSDSGDDGLAKAA